MFSEAGLLPPLAKFAHETVLTGLKKQLREHGLQKDVDNSGGNLAPIVIQRPAFKDEIFLVRPPSSGAGAADGDSAAAAEPVERLDYYSVPSRALANIMVRLGYRIISIVHLPDDESKLPPAVEERTRGPRAGAAGSCAQSDAYPAPRELIVPDVVVPIDKAASSETQQAQRCIRVDSNL